MNPLPFDLCDRHIHVMALPSSAPGPFKDKEISVPLRRNNWAADSLFDMVHLRVLGADAEKQTDLAVSKQDTHLLPCDLLSQRTRVLCWATPQRSSMISSDHLHTLSVSSQESPALPLVRLPQTLTASTTSNFNPTCDTYFLVKSDPIATFFIDPSQDSSPSCSSLTFGRPSLQM